MRGLILLLVAVSCVFGSNNYGTTKNAHAERLPLNNASYPQPPIYHPLERLDNVSPRLGAVAVNIGGPPIVTGGLDILPENWPKSFENIHSIAKEHATNEGLLIEDAFYAAPAGLKGAHNRAFHIAERIGEYEFMVWGGGSDSVEVINGYSAVEVNVTGSKPENAYGSSSAYDVFNHQVVVFGGLTETGMMSNEVHLYNISAKVWTKVAISSAVKPSGRYGATLTFAPYNQTTSSRFVLFGGVDSEGYSNEFWTLDLETFTWTLEEYSTIYYSKESTGPEDFVNGTSEDFEGRAFHGAFVTPNGIQYLFGESNGEAKVVNWIVGENDEYYVVEYEIENNVVLPPVRGGYAHTQLQFEVGTIDVDVKYIIGGVRAINKHIEESTLNAEVWVVVSAYSEESELEISVARRLFCYNGYRFDGETNVCVESNYDDCEECENCGDLSSFQKSYVKNLKEKAEARDLSGVLDQCKVEEQH